MNVLLRFKMEEAWGNFAHASRTADTETLNLLLQVVQHLCVDNGEQEKRIHKLEEINEDYASRLFRLEQEAKRGTHPRD